MDASFNESIENYKKFKEDKSPNTIAFAINKAEIAYRSLINEEKPNENALLRLEINVGLLYSLSNNQKKALLYLDKLKSKYSSIDSSKRREIAIAYARMGIISTELNDKINSFENFIDYFPSDNNSNIDYLLYQCEILTLLIVALEKIDNKPLLIEKNKQLHEKISCFSDTSYQVKVYNFLSVTHAKESSEISKNLLDKAIKILHEINNPEDVLLEAATYHNYGSILNATGYFNHAKENIQKSIELLTKLLKKSPNDEYSNLLLSDSYFNMGYALVNLKLLDEAEQYFEKSLDKAVEYSRILLACECLEAIGSINKSLKNYEKAVNSFEASLKLYNENENSNERNTNLKERLVSKLNKLNELKDMQIETNIPYKNKRIFTPSLTQDETEIIDQNPEMLNSKIEEESKSLNENLNVIYDLETKSSLLMKIQENEISEKVADKVNTENATSKLIENSNLVKSDVDSTFEIGKTEIVHDLEASMKKKNKQKVPILFENFNRGKIPNKDESKISQNISKTCLLS